MRPGRVLMVSVRRCGTVPVCTIAIRIRWYLQVWRHVRGEERRVRLQLVHQVVDLRLQLKKKAD
jgi:hypothetical protein